MVAGKQERGGGCDFFKSHQSMNKWVVSDEEEERVAMVVAVQSYDVTRSRRRQKEGQRWF